MPKPHKTDTPLDTNPRANDLQAPQDIQDRHGPNYDNDTSGWVRGYGAPYPHFDHTKKGK